MIDIQDAIERVLRLSRADACIVIGHRDASANLRWANNTVTTNGVAEKVLLSVVSIVGRRVASVRRTYFPPEDLESIVREAEAACERKPEAPDFAPLLEADDGVRDWDEPATDTGIRVFDRFVPDLARMFDRARADAIQTFGYAEHSSSTVWLATSTGLRRRHANRIGRVEITAKTPDFLQSSWTGTTTRDFADVDLRALFETLEQRLDWSRQKTGLPAGHYDVLLEPSCTADLAIGAYSFMNRRDADEGRSPYSKPGGGTRIGERMFGTIGMTSDPDDPEVIAEPFQAGVESGSSSSVFDNGLLAFRTDWVRDGELRALVTPRYWAAKIGLDRPVPFINNLIVAGDGPTLEEMIARTERALLVTCFWYIRTVDPQTALQTGLTRDGVFLIERGKVRSAVNNFRWNMSPIAALAHATEIGRSRMALPRENDEFLRTKAPPVRIERFNMSSPSEAT